MGSIRNHVSPQSQHASITEISTARDSPSTSPVLPRAPTTPLTALPQSTNPANPAQSGGDSLSPHVPLTPPVANATHSELEDNLPTAHPPVNTEQIAPEPRRKMSEKTYQAIYTPFSPSTHELPKYPALPVPSTERRYDAGVQRWRLWNLVWLEWVMTAILCIALFGALFGYSRPYIEMDGGLSTSHKRIFNSLSTGLSIALGLNLANSLRSYIKILRWRLLTLRYRPLTEFELVLGCDQQSNLLKLIWNVRNERYPFLPSVTQFLCILWIVINLAASILVAMLGLTYNISQSSSYASTSSGLVSVVNFTQLLNYGFLDGLSTVQGFGITGLSYGIVNGTLSYEDDYIAEYENIGDQSRYWFVDYDPNDFDLSVESRRYVDAVATCNAYPVTYGNFGNQSTVTYTKNSQPATHSIPVAALAGPGGLIFIADTVETCGPRCTRVEVLQAQADPEQLGDESDVTEARFFECNNTVSQVNNIPSVSHDAYLMSDQIARMLAGAVGWSGEQVTGDSQQYQPYAATTILTGQVYDNSNATTMAQTISEYSIGAVTALDDGNNDYVDRQTIQGQAPGKADYLQVVWWHAGPLLIGIPCLQLVSLIAVIGFGNRAVIKDGSFLAVAKLYKSTIDRLGDHGDILRGDEIVEALRDLGDGEEPRVIYAWKQTGKDDRGTLSHVGVFDEKSGFDVRTKLEEGLLVL